MNVIYPNASLSYVNVSDVDVVRKSSDNLSSGPVGVDGIVMAIAVLTPSDVILGGVFTSVSGKFAASIAIWSGRGDQPGDCVPTIGFEISDGSCSTPSVCCHGVGGIVYAIERVTNASFVLGGAFEMSFSHPDSQNLVQITVNSTLPDDVRSIIFPSSNYTALRTTRGPVNALSCVRHDSLDRCVELWVGGAFDTIVVDTFGRTKESRVVEAPIGLAVMRASVFPPIDSPVNVPVEYDVLAVPNLDRPFNLRVKSINTISSSSSGSIVTVGGLANETGDVFRLRSVGFTKDSRSVELANESAAMPPNSLTPGVYDTCPRGYFCPSGGVKVLCPSWGLYCDIGETELTKENICPAGSYCPDAATIRTCSKGHFCREGSTEPSPCFVFEICPRGSAKPDGSIYGVFIVAVLLFALWIVRFLYVRTRDRRRRKRQERNEILAVLGLEFLVPAWRRHEDSVAFDGVASSKSEGKEEEEEDDDDFSVVRTPPVLRRVESYSELIESKSVPAHVRFENICVTLEPRRLGDWFRCLPALRNVSNESGSAPLLDVEADRRSPHRSHRPRPRAILKNVSGEFRPGTLTAIMGPSGCGKTTLLSAIGGRLREPAKMRGTVTLNGHASSTGSLPADAASFVPQEDIMLRELTVRQVLWFSLLLKGNPSRSFDENERFLNNLLYTLDLYKVRHSFIGDENERGISGGQRKRVNIGIELVAEPAVLLLDEPTSGLDSTASADLVSNLKSFAKKGLTVSMVVHQPRAEILEMIDGLIVLREGGRLVYRGPSLGAMRFFESVGAIRSPMTSIADFILDVTTQRSSLPDEWVRYEQSLWGDEKRSSSDNGRKEKEGGFLGTTTNRETSPETGTIETGLGREDTPNFDDKERRKIAPRCRPSAWYQFVVFFRRGLIQHAWRRPWVMINDCATLIIAGGLLGAVFSDNDTNDLEMRYLLASLTFGLVGMSMSMRVFGNERCQFWREASAGTSVTAYYFGKNLSFWPRMMASPLLFLILFYNMTSPRYSFGWYYLTLVFCNFSVSQIGYLVSIAFEPRSALIVSVVLNVVCLLFAGVNPNVETMSATTYGNVGMTLSYARWAVEMQFLKELHNYPRVSYELGLVQDFLQKLGYLSDSWDDENYHDKKTSLDDYYAAAYKRCAFHLIVIGLGAMVLALLLLHRQARNNVI